MNEVRKSVQDAAYTAVGVGVLGAQQAAQLTQQAVDAAKAQVGESRVTATTTARTTAGDARSRVEGLVHDVRERVEPLVADVWGRIEPALDQLQVKADEVVAAGTAKARALLGRETTSSETRAA